MSSSACPALPAASLGAAQEGPGERAALSEALLPGSSAWLSPGIEEAGVQGFGRWPLPPASAPTRFATLVPSPAEKSPVYPPEGFFSNAALNLSIVFIALPKLSAALWINPSFTCPLRPRHCQPPLDQPLCLPGTPATQPFRANLPQRGLPHLSPPCPVTPLTCLQVEGHLSGTPSWYPSWRGMLRECSGGGAGRSGGGFGSSL